MTIHDQLFTDCVDKYNLAGSPTHLFQHGTNLLITGGEQLLMWEGKRVVKTFEAVPIEPKPVCCMKKSELLLLGSQTSAMLKCVFLEPLLFPMTIHILDAPPLSIIHFSSSLSALTSRGRFTLWSRLDKKLYPFTFSDDCMGRFGNGHRPIPE
jgi:hypothetical protein